VALLRGLRGHASEVDADRLEKEFAAILVEGEAIERVYKLVRDLRVFTTKRLILVDRQGVTGQRGVYLSIPYAAVTRFALETAGFFDADAELCLWLRGQAEPLKQEFRRGDDVHGLHRVLAQHVLK
jgi:PH (Pleckstrin Homology) domain-containing protein